MHPHSMLNYSVHNWKYTIYDLALSWAHGSGFWPLNHDDDKRQMNCQAESKCLIQLDQGWHYNAFGHFDSGIYMQEQ